MHFVSQFALLTTSKRVADNIPPVCMQDDNSLTSIGKGLALFGKYFRTGTIMSVGSSQRVRVWAVRQVGSSWVLLLLNKDFTPTQQTVLISACSVSESVKTIWQLTGTNYTDTKPTLKQVPNTLAAIANATLTIMLPPVSITAMEF